MTVLLLSTLALVWLAVSGVVLAACMLAGRTDRTLARKPLARPRELRLTQSKLVGHR